MGEPVTTQVQEGKSVGSKTMHCHELWWHCMFPGLRILAIIIKLLHSG